MDALIINETHGPRVVIPGDDRAMILAAWNSGRFGEGMMYQCVKGKFVLSIQFAAEMSKERGVNTYLFTIIAPQLMPTHGTGYGSIVEVGVRVVFNEFMTVHAVQKLLSGEE